MLTTDSDVEDGVEETVADPPPPPRTAIVDCDALVTSVFRAMLDRDPDEVALKAYGDGLHQGWLSADAFIDDVRRGPEARARKVVAGAESFAEVAPVVIAADPNEEPAIDSESAARVRRALESPEMLRALAMFALRRMSLASLFLIEQEVRSA